MHIYSISWALCDCVLWRISEKLWLMMTYILWHIFLDFHYCNDTVFGWVKINMTCLSMIHFSIKTTDRNTDFHALVSFEILGYFASITHFPSVYSGKWKHTKYTSKCLFSCTLSILLYILKVFYWGVCSYIIHWFYYCTLSVCICRFQLQ